MAIENDQNNSIAMHNLGLLYYQQNNLDLAEKYWLMALENNNDNSIIMCNLGHLHEKQNKFYLAIKYYLKALPVDATVLPKIIDIIPKVPQETQLLVLELVPQIRSNNEYFMKIPNTVHYMFLKKNIKISQYLSNYMINDIVDICLAYY